MSSSQPISPTEPAPPPARLPPPAAPGDKVGVAALSGPIEPERLAAGLEALRELGFEPVEARNLRSRAGLFAGDDRERLDAFHELAADPELRAIFFARGGHGVLRLLPRLDWDLLGRHPRAYVGYSDLTPFLGQVVERLGLVAFHGPMVAADLAAGLGAAERSSLERALRGELPMRYPLERARAAESREGVLLGGCLSLVTATLGTPFAPRLGGALLFLEDVEEPLYRLDRMLTHLRLSGTLGALGGLVLGRFGAPPEAVAEVASGSWGADVLEALVPNPRPPLGLGLEVGHGSPNLTLPLGLRARLDAEAGELTVLL